jgi:hypothetical protein
MICYFSQQLVLESVKSDKVHMVLYSVGILQQSLSLFEITNDKKSNNERNYSLSILLKCLPEVIKWMDFNMLNWYQYMQNILAVNIFNLFYKKMR